MTGSHKLCRDCGALKRRNEFSLRNIEKGYLSPYCKPCVVIRTNAWVDIHRERRNAYVRAHQVQPRVRAQRAAYKRCRYASDPAYRAARKDELRCYRLRHKGQSGGRAPSLYYPYLLDERLDGADLLLRINALIPRSVPEIIRADVCQEMALAVLTNEIDVGDAPNHIKSYVSRQYETISSKFRYMFLDEMSARALENVEFYAQQLTEAWG